MTSNDVCPKGMWITEAHAIRKLGSVSNLPSHVVMEAGNKSLKPSQHDPYVNHSFYYITKEGENASSNQTIKLVQWVQLCQALEQSTELTSFDPRAMALLARYSGKPINPSTFDTLIQDIMSAEAVVLPKDLTAAASSNNNDKSLDALLSQGPSAPRVGESATISGPATSNKVPEEGEIYIRADGKKVRRVKKKRTSAATTTGNLDGLLSAGNAAKPVGSGSATVTGATTAGGTPQEGEIYIRADGKKVRRVKKKRPSTAASTTGATPSLGSVLDQKTPASTTSGAATVTGATTAGSTPQEGEIYIRADGKKVRRVKKPKPAGAATGANTSSLGSLGIGSTPQSTTSGSATVTGATSTPHQEGEIYIRADGKKVRRVRKPKQTLDGHLSSNAGTSNVGSGSATVTGATTAGNTKVEEGEIYIRADGKKVRRIKKVRTSVTGSSAASVGPVGQQVGEIYIRPGMSKGCLFVCWQFYFILFFQSTYFAYRSTRIFFFIYCRWKESTSY